MNNQEIDKLFSFKEPDFPKKAKSQKTKNELRGVEVVRDLSGRVDKRATYYTISLRIPKEREESIRSAAWESHQTVTEYINALVLADLKKKKKL